MHAAKLDAPVAGLYVPAEARPSEQSQGGKAMPEEQARGSWARNPQKQTAVDTDLM